MIQMGKIVGVCVGLVLMSACSGADSDPGKIETRIVNGMEITAGQGPIPDSVRNPPATAATKAEPAVKPVDAKMHLAANVQKDEHGHDHSQEKPAQGNPPAPTPATPAQEQVDPAQPPKPSPKIGFKEKEWNFGTVIEGDECKHAFEFKNEGPGDLILTNVQPSCGCTAKKVTIFGAGGDGEKEYAMGSPIPAGTSGKIEAILNTANIHGAKSSRITVVSNDPASPSVALTVQAMVEQFFQLEPPNVYQGQIFGKAGAEATVKITCLKAEEFEVTGYEKIPDGLELEFTRPDPARKNYGEIKVKFKTGLPEGVFNQQVVAQTKIPGAEKPRSIRFVVTGTVLGPVGFSPAHVGFGLGQKGKELNSKLTIQNRDPKFALEVSDVEIDSPQKEFLTATLKKEMEGQTFIVELKVSDKCPPGVFKGTIKFKTNHPEKPEGKVSFSGVIR